MRHTKIIATIGPKTSDYASLEALALAGVDIFRLNFSHGTYEWYESLVSNIKKLNKKHGLLIPMMLDTKGPEIRTGELVKPVSLTVGQELVLTVENVDYESSGKLKVNYEAFIGDVEKGELILLDNGLIRLKVLRKRGKDVICEVLDAGTITSRRHLNIPGKEASLESVSEKDWQDIDFGIKHGMDFVALSFVRTAADIEKVRRHIQKKKSPMKIMAKIESFEATKHLSSIIEAADSVMVARGDLGAEVPFAEVPRLQQEIVDLAAFYQKPVLVATQMLESMIKSPMPTRAEVTDIAHAIYQQTDAIMLSGETASGDYPVRCVETMVEIAEVNEDIVGHMGIREIPFEGERALFAQLAANMPSLEESLEAIVAITHSGWTAQALSCFRPKVPIYAFTDDEVVARQLHLCYGVESFVIEIFADPEKTVKAVEKAFKKRYPTVKNLKFVLLSDSLVQKSLIPTLQVREWEK